MHIGGLLNMEILREHGNSVGFGGNMKNLREEK